MWEKEKMLLTSIFCFSRNVFRRPFYQHFSLHQNCFPKGIFHMVVKTQDCDVNVGIVPVGNSLTHSHTTTPFDAFGIQAFLKHWEKEKLLVTSNFSFSHSVFYPFGQLSSFFVIFEIVVCKLFQFGRV